MAASAFPLPAKRRAACITHGHPARPPCQGDLRPSSSGSRTWGGWLRLSLVGEGSRRQETKLSASSARASAHGVKQPVLKDCLVAQGILKKSRETAQRPVSVTLWLLRPQAGGFLHATFIACSPFLLRALSSRLEFPFNKVRGKGSAHCKEMRCLPASRSSAHLSTPHCPCADGSSSPLFHGEHLPGIRPARLQLERALRISSRLPKRPSSQQLRRALSHPRSTFPRYTRYVALR